MKGKASLLLTAAVLAASALGSLGQDAAGAGAAAATSASCLDMPISSALIDPSTCQVTGPTSDLISGAIPGDAATGRVVTVEGQRLRKLDFAGAGRVDVTSVRGSDACLQSASGRRGDLDLTAMRVAAAPTATCRSASSAPALSPTALQGSGARAGFGSMAASEVISPASAPSTAPPAPAASYYVWYSLLAQCGAGATTGCPLYVDGANEPAPSGGALVILDFGAPCFVPGSTPTVYGTQLFNTPGSPPPCTPNASLIPLVQAWVNGYESTHASGTPTAILGVGTSNSLTGADPQSNFALTDAQMGESGQAWFTQVAKPTATLVSGAAAPIVTWSADDLEESSGGDWYGPTASRAWVDGYGTAAGSSLSGSKTCLSNDPFRLGDYGDQVIGASTGWTTASSGGWSKSDIYYVAWNAAAACAVPEVYSSAMASEWANLSQQATQNGGSAIRFTGPMSMGGEIGTLSAADSWNTLAADTGQSPPYITVIGVLNPNSPGAPTGVTATPGDASARVSWTAVPVCPSSPCPAGSDGGSPVTSYTVSAIDSSGTVRSSATVSGLPPPTSATLGNLVNFTAYTFTVAATNALGTGAASSPSSPVVPGGAAARATTFYFAEGFTGGGFTESLDLLMPEASGTAYIDYYTEQGQLPTFGIQLTAGKVTSVDVNQYVDHYLGPGHSVSAVVNFPAAGVAERVMHFNGHWHGSTGIVGTTGLNTEWDFAEGSTISAFSEYLTLQNPSANPASVTLNYVTDSGAHPTRTLTLPKNSRTTVEVFNGNTLSGPASCAINAGVAVNCGVGPNVLGVSTQVLSSVPIVAERPMYVNGFNFGSGPIWDGHDAFGANAVATTWNFAEGTTLSGFNEYLTLQNPSSVSDATVNLKYVDLNGTVTNQSVTVAKQHRVTVNVADPTQGVGPGVGGVSVEVTSTNGVGIVAERPMYISHNFGTGIVGGAHDVMGSTTTAKFFAFSNASTVSGENDYLTIENVNPTAANVSITYYLPSGTVTRSFAVGTNRRHTVEVFNTAEGVGSGQSPVGIAVASDQPILVEEPTYSSNLSAYGATDTVGYMAPTS